MKTNHKMRLTILVYYYVYLLLWYYWRNFMSPSYFAGVIDVVKKFGGSNKCCYHIFLGPSISRWNMASAWDGMRYKWFIWNLCLWGVSTSSYVLICSPNISCIPRISSLYSRCGRVFEFRYLSVPIILLY